MIHTSPYPSVALADSSIFSLILPPAAQDPYPPHTPAFIDAEDGYTLTRAQLRALCLSLAWGLTRHFHVTGGLPLRRGDTLLIFSPNSIAWPVAAHAAMAAGLRITLANSAYSARELAHQWSDSRATVALVHPDLLAVVEDMFASLNIPRNDWKRRIIVAHPSLASAPQATDYLPMHDLIGKGQLDAEEQFTGPQIDETAYLCYSSGTTGLPKGVQTTHKNLTSVCKIVDPAIPGFEHGKNVLLGILPFYHIYGAVKLLNYPLLAGVPVVIMPRFDPVKFCAAVERYKITSVLVAPPVLVVLARHPAVDQYDMRTLAALMSGAAPLGAPLVHAVTNRLKKRGANIAIVQGYGLTETSPTTHILRAEHAISHVGSVGYLLPNLEARLVQDDGKDVAEGEPGELWLRGPTIMKGYLNNKKATEDAITPDGWFKTGDVATVKGHIYTIVDRKKELIKYKGFQVPPAELESLLLTHSDIADAGVTSVYSEEEATELPRAYIVHARGLETEAEQKAFAKDVQKWIQERVARHKYLRGGVVVVDAIPKSAAGKIFRRQLKERAAKEAAAESTKPKSKL